MFCTSERVPMSWIGYSPVWARSQSSCDSFYSISMSCFTILGIFAIKVLQIVCPCCYSLGFLHVCILWCTYCMIWRLIRHRASHQTLRVIHLWEDVATWPSMTVERHVQLYCYRRHTITKFIIRKTSVVQSMESTQYLFFTKTFGALNDRESSTESTIEK